MPPHAHYTALHGATEGGLCLSAFVVVRRGGRVLVLLPAPHERWKEDWAPNFASFSPEAVARQWNLIRLPGAYLREGEAPEAAARRVLEEQLGLPAAAVAGGRTHSFVAENPRHPGKVHWDLVWIFECEAAADVGPPPWIAAFEWREVASLRPEEFGSGHGDLLPLVGP